MMMTSTLYAAIELWKRMSNESRTAFVKWLAADTSVKLFTQAEVDEQIKAALEADRNSKPASAETLFHKSWDELHGKAD